VPTSDQPASVTRDPGGVPGHDTTEATGEQLARSGATARDVSPTARARAAWEPPMTERMHVLHVSAPTTEGCAVVALGYVREQLARGWNVTVACPSDGWLGYEARELGARVRWWPARREPTRGIPSELAALSGIVGELQPDLVHLHSSKAGLVGRLLLRGRRTTIFQPHGWSFLAAEGRTARAALAWERRALRWTDELVCVSAEELQVARAEGLDGPALVLPNGVDLGAWTYQDDDDRARARAELGLGGEPLAVCVGRLTTQKGQHDLLDVWGQVRAEEPAAQLVLVGDGPDRAALDDRAAHVEGVTLVGNRTDVTRWLAAADVVVVPSHWEGMALVPLEAMASGRSVVASRVTGIAESVPEGAGAIVPVGPSRDLVDALLRRLADRELADSEGRTGRAHVETHHDAATSADELAASYLRLLVGRRQR